MRRSLLLLALAAACGARAPDAEQVAKARARAEEATQKLMGSLMQELVAALEEGPPEKALAVCARKAQALTRGSAASDGLAIRRTALRVRNPQNAPDAYERAWLEQAVRQGPAATVRAEVVATDGGYELRYLKPIRLVALCTQCHGTADQIPPAVRAEIARLYPEDEATGFTTGDLRGAVSVRVRIE